MRKGIQELLKTTKGKGEGICKGEGKKGGALIRVEGHHRWGEGEG